MARINLSHHYKFRQLARALGSRAIARGTLELLWEAAYEVADSYIGTPTDIAEAVDWDGPPMARVDLLKTCGFLDDVGAQYVVHDLWAHAPKFVRLRWTREHPREKRPWITNARSAVPRKGTYPSLPFPVRRERTAAAPRDPIAVLTRLGHELHDEAFTTEADLKEALKTLAAQYAIPYDGRTISAALDRLLRSQRPVRVER